MSDLAASPDDTYDEDPVALGRKIVDSIRAYETKNGKGWRNS